MIHSANAFDKYSIEIPKETKQYLFAFSTLLLTLLIIYGNSFHNSWHYDDYVNIVENKNIRMDRLTWQNIEKAAFGTHWNTGLITRPLSYFTFGLNYFFNKTNVFGYHLVNFIIHYLTSILLFIVIRNTLKLPLIRGHYEKTGYAIALMATFLWATHPIHVSAVTYIVQRMAAMAALFYILTFYFYLKARTTASLSGRWGLFSLSFISAICAFASKENAFMLPMALGIFELVLIQGIGRYSIRKYLLLLCIPMLFILAAAIYFVDFTTISQSYEGRPFTLHERLLTQPRVIVYYLYLLVYPITANLTILHDVAISKSVWSPWTTFPAILTVGALMVLAVKSAKKYPLVAFCLIFFFLNHFIEGSFIALELIYEHRNYLPSMFIFVLPVIFWIKAYDFFADSRLLKALLAILFVFLLAGQSYTTRIYNDVYRDDFSLWKDTLVKSPGLSVVHINYGSALWESRQYEAAYTAFKRAQELDNYNNPDQKCIVQYNIGYYHLAIRHDSTKAIRHFKAAEPTFKSRPLFWSSLAQAYLMENNLDKAGDIIAEALNYWPKNNEVYHLQSILKFREGDFGSAYRIARSIHFKKPDYTEPLMVMGESCRQMNLLVEATKYYELAVERRPDKLRAIMALIEIYSREGEKRLRNERVVDLLYHRAGEHWDSIFADIAKKASITVYVPRPDTVLPLIEASLLELGKEASINNNSKQ